MHVRSWVWSCSLFIVLCGGCGSEAELKPKAQPLARLTREELMDPKTCAKCHPNHYREWEGSMHAYAAVDPVFIAMNQRGQRETNGELGSLCIGCHAPMAVREGLTRDGLNLDSVPDWAKGVTCYFCHNAVGLEDPNQHFNAKIVLANDDVMRGSFEGIDPGAHGVAKSSFHNSHSMDASLLCGTCHDVVTKDGHGAHIERTLKEYKESIFSFEHPTSQFAESCHGCHMPVTGEQDYIATNDQLNGNLKLTKRPHHEHRWPGVDIAMIDEFPGQAEQRLATECELHRSASVFSISVDPLGTFTILLETQAGHGQPSGTAQDRRLWLEFIAYDAEGKVLFESGTIAEGEVEQLPNDQRPNRAQLAMFRDRMKDAAGNEVHMFWEAEQPSESYVILPATMPGSVHTRTVRYRMPGNQKPARAVMRLRMRPIGIDVLQSLVDSGDLDAKYLARMETFTLNNTYVEWRAEDGDYVETDGLRFVEDLPDACDGLLRQ